MIQFNLLPDVKLQYIKAAKTKHMVIAISSVVVVVVIVISGLLVSSVFLQRNHITNLSNDISRYRSDLESTSDIDKILTIQNQLSQLPALHDQKPAASRLFSYISQTTPASVGLTGLNIKYEGSTLEVEGIAESLSSVNQYVDTIKFTTFSEEGVEGERSAFSEVVLSDFTVQSPITYRITFKFDPVIFDNTKNINLIVPTITTTRSETQKPDESQLFQNIEERGNE